MKWTEQELYMVEALAKNWAIDLNEVNPVMLGVLEKMQYPVLTVWEYREVEEAFIRVLKDSGLVNEGNVSPILGAVRHILERRGVDAD